MHKIAFLGLGAMGSRMAVHLAQAGYPLTVWNRSPRNLDQWRSLGATVADTPRAAAEGADVVISMLTDDNASQAVWNDAGGGALAGLRQEALAIEISTVSPSRVQALAQDVAARGARFLDAPVSGSLPQAEARQLVFFVGGDTVAFDQAKPILERMGGAIHHLGPVGRGIAFKLAVNELLAVQVAAWAEVLGSLAKAGVAVPQAVEVLSKLPVASPAAVNVGNLIARQDFEPRFTNALVAKDLRYAVEDAQRLGAGLPLAQAAREVFEAACAAGLGERNMSAAAKLYQ
jgi:3-hydroxyisobutyrate dehydrogenase